LFVGSNQSLFFEQLDQVFDAITGDQSSIRLARKVPSSGVNNFVTIAAKLPLASKMGPPELPGITASNINVGWIQ